MSAPARSAWKRREGGYMRADGQWFAQRGAPMHGGGTAWLVMRRVTDEAQVGRDSFSCYDTRNGQVLWQITADGYTDTAPADFTGDLFAHDWDAGSLAEAKYVATTVEARETDA